jgi:hypothetical protein
VLAIIIQLDHFLRTKLVHKDDEQSPRPWEHYHLIGGTSVGALLAIFFGLLGMSCNGARDAYIQLAELVHIEEVDTSKISIMSSESHREAFKQVLELLIEKRTGDRSTTMKQIMHAGEKGNSFCRVRTCSINLFHIPISNTTFFPL